MRHSAEGYLDQALTGGLTALQEWDGDAVNIFPLIKWEGLRNVSLAWLSLMNQYVDFGDGFMDKLARLNELSRAYAALMMWKSGLANPRCLTHEQDCGVEEHDLVRDWLGERYRLGNSRQYDAPLGLLHHDDMVAIDHYFSSRDALAA